MSESNPFDSPNWDGIGRPVARVKHTKDDSFIGCPMAWVHAVWPHVQSKEQLIVAMFLFRHHHLYRSKPFAFSNAETGALGISGKAKHGALANLEKAGLIEIEWANGRSPVVTVKWLTPEGSTGLSVS
jgi:hypothetical protein